MSQVHESRYSDNPYIDRVWRTQCLTDGVYLATPDMSWDFILAVTAEGAKTMMIAGQATKSSHLPYKAGTRSVVISLSASAYMPDIPGETLRDTVLLLPIIDDECFELLGRRFALPTYERAEEFINQLVQLGLLASDEVVEKALQGSPKATSRRSAQRHFAKAAGTTQKELQQISRAQEAVRQLKQGKAPFHVAAETGYSDQSHMIKSLKRIMDSMPSDVDDIHKL